MIFPLLSGMILRAGYLSSICNDGPSTNITPAEILKKYNVDIDEKFTDNQKWAILHAVYRVGSRLAEKRNKNESAADAFKNVYSAVHFQLGCGDDCRSKDKNGKPYGNEGGAFSSGWQANNGNGYFLIKIGTMVDDGGMRGTIHMVHELGHAYDYAMGDISRKGSMPDNVFTRDSLRPNGYWYNGIFTADKTVLGWQMHPPKDGEDDSRGETFADIFVAWTFNAWNTNPDNANAVTAAQGWMP